ncbi:uncharacterized protein METZ01_LOCUS7094 [marine metagenome]|uniref:Uncharacterized protein n=1 Tax=marine metagenome TaxID=408172 RepID=A0A381NI42_9ZZZZ
MRATDREKPEQNLPFNFILRVKDRMWIVLLCVGL